jgi:signal transduction histidine kinase
LPLALSRIWSLVLIVEACAGPSKLPFGKLTLALATVVRRSTFRCRHIRSGFARFAFEEVFDLVRPGTRRPPHPVKTIQTSLLRTIQEEAERLNRFIGNLLDMTRLESGAA